MSDLPHFMLYLASAFVLAILPGPGVVYVAARALAGGRTEGVASSVGTGLGGMVHVAAGGLGVSALVLASAQVFAALKLAGAAYLVWLGLRTLIGARALQTQARVRPAGAWRAFREGVVVEALNPKTAGFFLAFIPQFLDVTRGHIGLQFIALGFLSVALNTLADVTVAYAAGGVRAGVAAHPRLARRLREASGGFLIALGVGLSLARRPTG
jgi:threonine/homoserine/homoserine lactone efflux protein